MSSPKLNGRPIEYDIDDLTDKLLAWAQEDDSINFCGFCADYRVVPSRLTTYSQTNESFRNAYSLAKVIIGARRERKLNENTMHSKAYDLNARTYDEFMDKKHSQIAKEGKTVNDDGQTPDQHLTEGA